MTLDPTTITGCPNATLPLQGNERLVMDQGTQTVDASTQDVANLAAPTNLSYDPATRLLSSSTGADVTLPLVSTTAAGLVPLGWLTGAEAAILPHIHGDLAGRQYAHVRNVSGVQLAAGTPVCVVGAVGDTDRLEVVAADAGDPTKMPAFALLDAALAATGSGRDGHGVISGETVNQNTAAFALRAEVFVAVGGGLTSTIPTSGRVQSVGSISRSHASTGSLAVAIGPALGNAALRNIGTIAGTVAAGDDGRLSDNREWTAETITQAEAEAGTAATRRAWTAQRVRQAITNWWSGAKAAPGAIGESSPSTGRFTSVGLGGVAPRTGYAAVLGSNVLPRAQIVTVAGSTYTCDIRVANRFMLAAAIAGNTTITFSNVADLAVTSTFAEYVEVEVDFRYTSGIITISAAGFTTTWDGNSAATPTAGEIETLIVRITPAIASTPFSTATVYVAPMRGRT